MDLFGHADLSKLTEGQECSFRLLKKKVLEDESLDFSYFMSDVTVEMLELFESKREF
jgi:hypothetical protein